MKSKFGLKHILFISLFIVGVFLRLWQINSVPKELFGDEIDVGLQAYSILTTGKDYLGNRFPVMFHSFSEYRLPYQLYVDVPFIKLFGLGGLGVRMPSVLMGLLTLIALYFLVKELFDTKLALISTLFLLFSPWHVNFSRQANDAGMILPFVILGTLFFAKGLRRFNYFLLSVIFFSIGIYTYAIAALFIPVFFIVLFIIYRGAVIKFGLKRLFIAGIIGITVLLPYINSTFSGKTTKRFSDIQVASHDEIMQEVVEGRRWSGSFITRVFYNKNRVYFEKVIKNYMSAFSTNFLFTRGDSNMRQAIEGFGQMYYFDIPLLLLGIFVLLRGLNKKSGESSKFKLIFLWLLFAPVPSALTRNGGTHASRLTLMLPPLVLLSSLGFVHMANSLKNFKMKLLFTAFVILAAFNVLYFIHRYFVIWPNISWRFWQYGYKDTLAFVKSVDGNYQKIIFNNTYEPSLPRFLFYYGYDMNQFQKQFKGDVHQVNIIEGLNGFSLGDKYYFGELKKPIERLAKQGTLVVASAEKDATNPSIFENSNLDLLKTVNSPDDIPIFYVYTEISR